MMIFISLLEIKIWSIAVKETVVNKQFLSYIPGKCNKDMLLSLHQIDTNACGNNFFFMALATAFSSRAGISIGAQFVIAKDLSEDSRQKDTIFIN